MRLPRVASACRFFPENLLDLHRPTRIAAVVAPEIVVQQGHLLSTYRDARLFAALAATGYFFWRRGILGTIVTGTLVMVALRAGVGW